jgi:hypothetical protein
MKRGGKFGGRCVDIVKFFQKSSNNNKIYEEYLTNFLLQIHIKGTHQNWHGYQA